MTSKRMKSSEASATFGDEPVEVLDSVHKSLFFERRQLSHKSEPEVVTRVEYYLRCRDCLSSITLSFPVDQLKMESTVEAFEAKARACAEHLLLRDHPMCGLEGKLS